jgi:hypothetical protein
MDSMVWNAWVYAAALIYLDVVWWKAAIITGDRLYKYGAKFRRKTIDAIRCCNIDRCAGGVGWRIASLGNVE